MTTGKDGGDDAFRCGTIPRLIQDDTGNCYAACISMLTEIPFRHLRASHQEIGALGSAVLYARMLRLLAERGWTRRVVRDSAPPGFAVAIGRSPRGPWNHAVIVRDGQFYHDPHPDGNFIERVASYHAFAPSPL